MHSLKAIFYYLLNSVSITLSVADKNYTSWKFWVSLICQSLRWYSWCSTYGSHLTILLIFFLFVWIKYFTFYISKRTVSMLSISCIILQIWFLERNNIYEIVSMRRQGSILNPKAPFPVHLLLFACTIKWKFQDSFSIT